MHRAEPVSCTHFPMGMALSWLLLLSCVLAVGCTSHPRKQIPPGWEVATDEVSSITLATHDTTQAGDASAVATVPQAKIQVFICYGWMTSNHACMRIDGPDHHTLFWDPGGGYGQHNDDIPTKYDLLLDQDAITTEQVWHYRSVGCNEPAVLMFEWPLTQQEARDLRDVLVEGKRKDGHGGEFKSDVPGGFCSMALSSYLRRFFSHTPLSRRWFWPHNLAKQLWQYKPSRVVLYQRKKEPVVYVAGKAMRSTDATLSAQRNAE